jgi:acyl-CoA reductase-like NAD-dependent aldehyde dehydrogenase
MINNQLVPTPTTRHSTNPSTGEPLFDVPVARQEDLDSAVRHAREAFKTWSKTTHEERAKLLLAFADRIEENRKEIEKLQTTEQGKPLSLSETEVSMTLQWLRIFATMKLEDEIVEDTDERTIYSTFLPLEVCAGLIPWNWLILLGMGKLGPAIMTGNVFIMKPSPYTPYCDLKLGELGMSIFPAGRLPSAQRGRQPGPVDHRAPGHRYGGSYGLYSDRQEGGRQLCQDAETVYPRARWE